MKLIKFLLLVMGGYIMGAGLACDHPVLIAIIGWLVMVAGLFLKIRKVRTYKKGFNEALEYMYHEACSSAAMGMKHENFKKFMDELQELKDNSKK